MKAFDSYGSALLGAAIRTVFPQATYLGSKVDSRGFCATFADDSPFQEGYLPMLENAMQKLAEEPTEIMEMLGSNAMEMLAHYEQPKPKQLTGVVFVIKIGSAFEVCERRPQIAKDFALFRFTQDERRITIWGKAFGSRKEKQRFEKRYRKWIDHCELARKLELYEGEIYHPRGILLKHFLIDCQRKYFQSLGFLEIEAPDPTLYAKEHGLNRVICKNRFYLFGPDAFSSSLQIIQKWITIFRFESIWVFGSKKLKKDVQNALELTGVPYEIDPNAAHPFLELQVIDYLGCPQRGARLERAGREGYSFSFVEMDQWIPLLLEKDRGKLPHWLAPEQIRLLTEEGVEISQVTKNFRIANIRYTVDRGGEPLKEKMYRALRVNVPYVMVFGNHEEKERQMMIRASSSNESKTIFLTQLHQFLSELQIESE